MPPIISPRKSKIQNHPLQRPSTTSGNNNNGDVPRLDLTFLRRAGLPMLNTTRTGRKMENIPSSNGHQTVRSGIHLFPRRIYDISPRARELILRIAPSLHSEPLSEWEGHILLTEVEKFAEEEREYFQKREEEKKAKFVVEHIGTHVEKVKPPEFQDVFERLSKKMTAVTAKINPNWRQELMSQERAIKDELSQISAEIKMGETKLMEIQYKALSADEINYSKLHQERLRRGSFTADRFAERKERESAAHKERLEKAAKLRKEREESQMKKAEQDLVKKGDRKRILPVAYRSVYADHRAPMLYYQEEYDPSHHTSFFTTQQQQDLPGRRNSGLSQSSTSASVQTPRYSHTPPTSSYLDGQFGDMSFGEKERGGILKSSIQTSVNVQPAAGFSGSVLPMGGGASGDVKLERRSSVKFMTPAGSDGKGGGGGGGGGDNSNNNNAGGGGGGGGDRHGWSNADSSMRGSRYGMFGPSAEVALPSIDDRPASGISESSTYAPGNVFNRSLMRLSSFASYVSATSELGHIAESEEDSGNNSTTRSSLGADDQQMQQLQQFQQQQQQQQAALLKRNVSSSNSSRSNATTGITTAPTPTTILKPQPPPGLNNTSTSFYPPPRVKFARTTSELGMESKDGSNSDSSVGNINVVEGPKILTIDDVWN